MTHDYRNRLRCWGWDIGYTLLPGNRLRAHGWGDGLSAGDYVLLSNGDGDTRYRVGDDFRYERDPSDMWFATLHFAPREDPVPA